MTNNQLQVFGNYIEQLQPKFEKLSEDAKLKFETEKLHAMTLLSKNDFLAKTAQENKSSLASALLSLATIDLTLNPAMRLAYLVPRDRAVCLDISYMGLVELAYRSGIKKINCQLVYANDDFFYDGSNDELRHGFNPFGSDRGEFVGGYVKALLDSGQWTTTVMSAKEIYSIRDRSMAFKRGKSSPWTTDEGEMIKKSIIKRAFKMWPKSEKLAAAIEYTNVSEGIDFEKEREELEKKQAERIDEIVRDNEELQKLREEVALAIEKACEPLTAIEKMELLDNFGISFIHDIYAIKEKERLESMLEKANFSS